MNTSAAPAPTPPEHRVVAVDNLTVSFATSERTVTAVNNLSFHVDRGETLAIVGESGSGKSVTSLSLMRLVEHGGGKITQGQLLLRRNSGQTLDLARADNATLRGVRGGDVAMIFQEPMTSLNPVFTIGEQIAESIRLHQGKDHAGALAEALRMLELVRIPEAKQVLQRHPHQLSGGMRQRAMIAMALACKPALLIADEPTTALDVTIQAQILELMNDLRHKLGMSIIMITHDLGVVAQMCEKIAVMYAGHIVEYGTTDEIFYNPQHEYTKGLINSIPKLNAEEKERLVPIEGQPVDLLNPPAGCPFAPRCKSCMKVCLNKMPPRTELSDTHYTYCWLRQKEEFEKGGKA